ncbi:MAG: B12-binding domain-containing radical SAM protein [Deltaproteobacteria bacterium]
MSPTMLPEERYGGFASVGSFLPPLGLLYLAAAVGDRCVVRILDGSVRPMTTDDVVSEVREFRPHVVGITVMTPTLTRALSLCRAIKKHDPEVTTVLGGPHPSALPEETAAAPGVDFVVVGEGERTFPELLDALGDAAPIDSVDGLCFFREGKIVRTRARKRIRDLDAVPFPARHLLDHTLYKPSAAHYRSKPAFSVMCGRGCPYRCTFCSCSKVFRDGVTVRSPEGVAEEIRHLVARYGAREILLWDDTFGLSREWTLRFCELVRPLGISWSAWMRCDLADRERLNAMARSGCWHVSYGVESGNQGILDGIRKDQTLDQVRRAFALTREAGMEARGTFILGLPGENRDTLRETVDFAIEIKADYAQFQFLTPYPGTELWESVPDHGRFLTGDLSKYTIWFPVYVPKGLTREDLETALRTAYRRFYLSPSYLLRRLARIRTLEDLERNLSGLKALCGLLAADVPAVRRHPCRVAR